MNGLSVKGSNPRMALPGPASKRSEELIIKCVVWDLDGTLWNGVLLENDHIRLRGKAVDIVKALDGRGILHSIASRNDCTTAMAKLEEFGLAEYFVHPQINWNSKVTSIEAIANLINVGLGAIAFIDDQPSELEEVRFSLPDVLCINSASLDRLLEMPEMTPPFITEVSRNRRLMYISEMDRKKAEEEFAGPKEEFLATLNMVLTISDVEEQDLRRAEELTVRTNQLNTTGYTYSYEELRSLIQSDRHKLLMASLDDKFGSYSKIGLALLECHEDSWTIKLLLMSCRVMSRGVGTVMMNHIMRMAKERNVGLRAEFVSNNRNRLMYVTYKFAGFKEVNRVGDVIILESDLMRIQPTPEYMEVRILN